MGEPKALLILDGATFLSRVVSAMHAGGCDPLVVVTGPVEDSDAAEIARHASEVGAAVVVNPDRDSEQVASLRIALAALPEDLEGVVVSPVDAPATTPPVVSALVRAVREGAAVAVPTYQGRRGHPIAFGRETFWDILDPELPMGARSVLQRHALRLAELELGEPGVLLDIDTPEQYQRLREVRS